MIHLEFKNYIKKWHMISALHMTLRGHRVKNIGKCMLMNAKVAGFAFHFKDPYQNLIFRKENVINIFVYLYLLNFLYIVMDFPTQILDLEIEIFFNSDIQSLKFCAQIDRNKSFATDISLSQYFINVKCNLLK
ncbi:hypothetical protein C0J52_03156 [Blattella germanica]|nr:hypothetical protein C0J52_03156 [Blattella germanica]